jgi:hypothetical protein
VHVCPEGALSVPDVRRSAPSIALPGKYTM